MNSYEKFAGLLCCQLHHQPEIFRENTGGESRTRKNLFLRQAPLPFGYAGVKELSGQSDLNPRLTDLQSAALNQLGYARKVWSARRDSNPQQFDWKSRVQPVELHALICFLKKRAVQDSNLHSITLEE